MPAHKSVLQFVRGFIDQYIYIFISPTGSTSKQEKNQQSIKSHDRA